MIITHSMKVCRAQLPQSTSMVKVTTTLGFALAWKVLEYTGLSWKVFKNKISLEKYLKNTQRHGMNYGPGMNYNQVY